MAVKTENTMAEGLQSIMQDLATLKMTPDADIGLCVRLETEILKWLQQGQMANTQQPSMGMPPGPPGGMPGGMPPTGGVPGGLQLPSSPLAGRALANQPMPPMQPQGGGNVDELRRMLA